MITNLDDSNFILYAAQNYDNPSCESTEEFYDDLKRFKYLSRLFGKYKESGVLKERLILNHINVLYNVFGDATTKMLFFRLENYYSYLLPFLILIGKMPNTINIKNKIVRSSDISLDSNIIEKLRQL